MGGYYDTLISVDTCRQGLTRSDWRVIDCRFDLADRQRGPAAYREGHIPGACYADLEADLSGVPGPGSGRHPLPDWRAFAGCLGRWAIRGDTQVVVYDQGSGAFAARLWWLLRTVGHRRVAVLDGGWSAWQAAGGLADRIVSPVSSRMVKLSVGSGWVTTGQVELNLMNNEFVLIDARSSPRFAGLQEPIDPVAGHIPGARNFPFERNLDQAGTFLAAADLRRQWLACLQGWSAAEVVHMCGSGVTACQNLLAMEVAGLTGSRLYVGSWSEWIRNSAHPVETGPV